MGASCSSSSDKRYREALTYLLSKPCTTYTYSRAFSPIVKDLPHVIIIGEHHLKNPSRQLSQENRNCSTFSGILNELVSICSHPISKPTVFIEDKVEDTEHNVKRETKDVLLDVYNRENPFNVNRQKVLLDHMERKFDRDVIQIVRSDIFFIARAQFLFQGEIPSVSTIELFTDSNLRSWTKRMINMNDYQYDILKVQGKKVAQEHWSHFENEMRQDRLLKYIAEFSHIIFLFLKTYPTRLFHSGVHEHMINKFIEMFLSIEENFIPTPQKRKRDSYNEPIDEIPHYNDVGNLISFLGDILNFYHISNVNGIVLISYGQLHSENFAELFEESKLYKLDHQFGEDLDD